MNFMFFVAVRIVKTETARYILINFNNTVFYLVKPVVNCGKMRHFCRYLKFGALTTVSKR